jgi:hypothetical protein
MNKLILVLAFIIMLFTSCKKHYLCTCTSSYQITPGGSSSPLPTTYSTIYDTKKGATSTCTEQDRIGSGYPAVNCVIN